MDLNKTTLRARRLLEILFLYKNWVLILLNRFNLKSIEKARLRNGLIFFLGGIPSARAILSHTFNKNEGYDIFQDIKKGDVVVDIGAFIGDFSIKAANKGAKVYSYEPCKKTFEIFLKNIKLNNLEDRISFFNKGIYKESGQKDLIIREDHGVNSMIGGNVLDHRSKTIGAEKIKLITFKQLFDSNKIKQCDFLKIDCEGVEYDIIMSIPLNYLKRIKYISMESTDYGKTNIKNKKLIDHLRKNKFKVNYFNASVQKIAKGEDINTIRLFAKRK